MLIGVGGGRVAVGLPGNPVSHFAAFHVFVRRILALLGGLPAPGWRRVCLRNANVVRPDSRETFWPAFLAEAGVEPLAWLDSGHLGALVGVNALLRVPAGKQLLAGEPVEVLSCAP